MKARSKGDECAVVEERKCVVGRGDVGDSQLAPTLNKEVETDSSQVEGQLAPTLSEEVEADSRQVEGAKAQCTRWSGERILPPIEKTTKECVAAN